MSCHAQPIGYGAANDRRHEPVSEVNYQLDRAPSGEIWALLTRSSSK
jgi:hypothetical protein